MTSCFQKLVQALKDTDQSCCFVIQLGSFYRPALKKGGYIGYGLPFVLSIRSFVYSSVHSSVIIFSFLLNIFRILL